MYDNKHGENYAAKYFALELLHEELAEVDAQPQPAQVSNRWNFPPPDQSGVC